VRRENMVEPVIDGNREYSPDENNTNKSNLFEKGTSLKVVTTPGLIDLWL
jgi:hypothetical protein